LVVLEQPNHTAPWKASKPIKVLPANKWRRPSGVSRPWVYRGSRIQLIL
jgi:hypothetical protein